MMLILFATKLIIDMNFITRKYYLKRKFWLKKILKIKETLDHMI